LGARGRRAHRLGHAKALGDDPDVYGETRHESATERLDQIDYDLRNAEDLAAAGVELEFSALQAEREVLGA